MYRITRDGESIIVHRLTAPDAAGNTHWVVVVRLRNDDIAPDGRKAAELTDSEIVALVAGNMPC